MVSLLLIISFLLHVVILIALFNLFKQVTQLKEQDTTEIDHLLSTYLAEIKAENDRLQKQIDKTNSIATINTEKKVDNYTRSDIIKPVQKKYAEKQEDTSLVSKAKDDVIETSLEATALQLYEQGHSVTNIAQQLNRGKTEVSLIIELNKRENISEHS